MCGEKLRQPPGWQYGEGSPPRVRGKDDATLAQNTADRITPACAGKRIYSRDILIVVRDHPRVCGEKKKGGKPGRPG